MDFFEDNNNEEFTPILAASKKKGEDDYDGQLTVDVYQNNDDIIVQSTVAGVDQNDIDISVTTDMVTIKGKRSTQEKIKPSDYYYQELFWGPFSRSIILPEDVDSDNAKASMKNGLLTIRLPKLAKTKIKKVRISE